jgi:hypothetical protein
MLSDVLQALARRLQFRLHFEADNDRQITIDLEQPARELIETLGRDDNVMITTERNDRCAEPVEVLASVWFLGTGPEITYEPARVTGVDGLPATGSAAAAFPAPKKRTHRHDQDDVKSGKVEIKDKRDMTPEERYLEKIRRKTAKGKR